MHNSASKKPVKYSLNPILLLNASPQRLLPQQGSRGASITRAIIHDSWVARVKEPCRVKGTVASRHTADTTVPQTIVIASLCCRRVVKGHPDTSRRGIGICDTGQIVGVLTVVDAVLEVKGNEWLQRGTAERAGALDLIVGGRIGLLREVVVVALRGGVGIGWWGGRWAFGVVTICSRWRC